MADAFRIAFEQQLMRKNDQALRLTQMDKYVKATKWISGSTLKMVNMNYNNQVAFSCLVILKHTVVNIIDISDILMIYLKI